MICERCHYVFSSDEQLTPFQRAIQLRGEPLAQFSIQCPRCYACLLVGHDYRIKDAIELAKAVLQKEDLETIEEAKAMEEKRCPQWIPAHIAPAVVKWWIDDGEKS